MYVKKAIIHILNSEGIVMNDRELELDKECSEFVDFMILKFINSTNLRQCKFNNWENNKLRIFVDKIIDGYNFAKYSRYIAMDLYENMVRNNKELSNDFLVVLYEHDEKYYVAGICLQSQDIFESRTQVIDGEVRIDVNKNSLSYSDTKLLKYGFSCGYAFEDSKWDLLTLDRREDYFEDDSVFIKRFIDGTKIKDSRYLTRKFIKLCKSWANNNLGGDVKSFLIFMRALRDLMDYEDGEYLDIERFCIDALRDDLKRTAFMIMIKINDFPDGFNIDKRIVRNNLRKIKVKTDDFEIEIPYKKFEVWKFDVSINPDGSSKVSFNTSGVYQ